MIASEDDTERRSKMSDKLRPESDSEDQNLLSLYDSDFLESIYKRATQCENTSESYRKNAGVLRSISGYRDASALAKEYEQTATELEKKENEEEAKRKERERAETLERQKKSDARQIKFYTVGITVLSLFLVFLVCYNTFLGALIKKRKVLDEIYPLTYDEVTVITKKEAPWFKINECGEISFDKDAYTGDGNLVIPDVFDNTLVTAIAEVGFTRSDCIKTVVISDFVEDINEEAFAYCTNLESVTLPSSAVQIGAHAFHGCSSLKNVEFPDATVRICKGAFSGCSSLETLTLPLSLEYIEEYAFQNCASLKTMTLGSGIKEIEIRAFSGCPLLKTVYYGGSEEELKNLKENGGIAIDNGPFDAPESDGVNIVYNHSAK